MIVRWSKKAKEQYYETLEYVFDEWGEKAADKLQIAVYLVEENLKNEIVEYPLSKKMNIHKCIILRKNLLLYKKMNGCIEVVAFIDTRSNHPY